jgi:hypothetical protein
MTDTKAREIEMVARALCQHDCDLDNPNDKCAPGKCGDSRVWKGLAAAAIAALDAARTPPADLVERDRETAESIAEACVQIALDVRDSPPDDVSGDDWKMGFGFAANKIAVRIRALTSSRAAPAPVPDMDAMLDAGVEALASDESINPWPSAYAKGETRRRLAVAYQAMIEAAPAPPSSEGKP